MAGKRIVVPNYMPALDLTGGPVPGAKLYFYENGTTTLKAIYTSAGLSVAHPNPVVANAAGVFPSIFADEAEEFSVAITDADGSPIGGLRNRDDIRPSLSFLDGVEAPVSDVMADVLEEETLALARTAMGTDLAANVNVAQSGTGAVTRTAEAKMRDVLNAADFLPVGYVTDGSVDYTTQLQAAIAAAIASRRALRFPGGTFKITGTGLSITSPIRMFGEGSQNSVLKNLSGNVLRLASEFVDVSDLGLWSEGGGHTVLQTGLVAQSEWRSVHVVQNSDGYSVWENAGHEFIDMRFFSCKLQHTTTSTVYAFNLTGIGGIINDNLWLSCRIQHSGTKHFFNIETSTGLPNFSNRWQDCTWEICLGGGVRVRGMYGYVIDNCQNWDAGTGAIVNDFYDIGSGVGIGAVGTIRDCGRWAGSLAVGKYDVVLPTGGAGTGTQILNCRTAGGGDPFKVDARNNGIEFYGPPSIFSFTNTAGQSGLDPTQGYLVGGTRVLAPRITGWALDTGTAKRTANATYAAGATLTFSAAYTQAELTALATRLAAVEAALQNSSQTVKALKDDLHATAGHGLIGT